MKLQVQTPVPLKQKRKTEERILPQKNEIFKKE
jgi:hypothetical protein